MSERLDSAHVERALRKAAALRNLCLRLPRILSPHERALEDELGSFARGDTESCSDAALFVGLREAFRRRDAAFVSRVARLVPERIARDLDLATWAAWARWVEEMGGGESAEGQQP